MDECPASHILSIVRFPVTKVTLTSHSDSGAATEIVNGVTVSV